jgi:hypothetical protein
MCHHSADHLPWAAPALSVSGSPCPCPATELTSPCSAPVLVGSRAKTPVPELVEAAAAMAEQLPFADEASAMSPSTTPLVCATELPTQRRRARPRRSTVCTAKYQAAPYRWAIRPVRQGRGPHRQHKPTAPVLCHWAMSRYRPTGLFHFFPIF